MKYLITVMTIMIIIIWIMSNDSECASYHKDDNNNGQANGNYARHNHVNNTIMVTIPEIKMTIKYNI